MMNNAIERRRFLKICAGTGIVVAVLPLGIYVLDNKSRLTEFVHRILDKNLPGTIISQADIKQFSDDFFVEGSDIALKTHIFSVLDPVIRIASGFDDKLHGKIYSLERSVVTNFLLNSNFFESDSNKKTVTYYGASNTICRRANPFAQFLTA